MFDDRYNGLTLDDAAAQAGGYVDFRPGKNRIPDYDFHAAIIYCKEKGIEKSDMTAEEWDMFEIRPSLQEA
jgi:hypothetical protein